jgi:hypothetical protein
MKKVEVLQGTSSHYYHVVPSELERVTITPEKSAIFEYLSRIGSDRFVDFISDILVHVEGHKLVDNTDGPGDEKQDVLTLDPKGERHLTQCKHTTKYEDKTSGDELDLMVTACLRKNCRAAVWVTNADLTPQAKRYVNDGEYLRGWPEGAKFTPTVDYRNGERIWTRIAKNPQILNKWFGGTAQSHGLRTFFTDLVILSMPDGNYQDMKVAELAAKLGTVNPSAGQDDDAFSVQIDENFMATISSSFASPADLRLPFSDPRSASMPLNAPFGALRIHAAVSGNAVYDPEQLLERLVAKIGASLPNPDITSWWYLAAAPAQAFVFLQDVAKPVLVPIGTPKTFVRAGNEPTTGEQDWALAPGSGFIAERAGEDYEDDDLIWQHEETGSKLIVLVSQALPVWRIADLFLRQEQISSRLRGFTFWAIENASDVAVSKVRNLCPPDWTILQSSGGDLFWAHPPDKQTEALEIAGVLDRLGIRCLRVGDEDRDSIIGNAAASPSESGMITSSRRDLLTPIRLEERIFWLSDKLPFSGKLQREVLIDLLKLKSGYEEKHGYDLMQGKDSMTIAGEEVYRILADPFTIRGRRMLDIGFGDNELLLNVRIRGDNSSSGKDIADECLREMAAVKVQIAQVL